MTPRRTHPEDDQFLLSMFDLRQAGIAQRLIREYEGWPSRADVEMLDLDHAVLIIKAGVSPEVQRG